MRNIDGFFNKERFIEYTVEINIYYQRHRKKTEIDVIGEQKQSVILGILWLACYNSEIDQRTKKAKMMKFLKEYRKQQRLKQRKSEQQKQKQKQKERKKQEEKEKVKN